MKLESDESGFYLGTASIGYVLAIIFVIVPICFLVVNDKLSVWTGVNIGLIASVALFLILYPFLLCCVVMFHTVVQASELPNNQIGDQDR